MGRKDVLRHVRIAWKDFIPVFLIIVNSFAWYSSAYYLFAKMINDLQITSAETFMLFSAFYVGMTVSAIVGPTLFKNKRTALLLWLLAGVFSTILLDVINSSSYAITFAVSLFLGVSIGIGLPSCLAYFADSTGVENRGLLGGVTWCISGIAIFLLGVASNTFGSSLMVLILAAWRSLGLIILFFLMKTENPRQTRVIPSYSSILSRKTVILCLAPWIMFCIVNWIEAPLLENLFGNFYNIALLISFATSSISALAGGFFADWIGRKRVIITGFILLGIEYAALSLLIETQVSWYLYAVLDGTTWGMFSVVFFMVLWGDLAESMKTDKFYVIGGLPYLLANFLSMLISPYAEFIPITTAFSLASFFLFLAVLPLMYAPETLPETDIRRRELERYVEEAKRLKEKHL